MCDSCVVGLTRWKDRRAYPAPAGSPVLGAIDQSAPSSEKHYSLASTAKGEPVPYQRQDSLKSTTSYNPTLPLSISTDAPSVQCYFQGSRQQNGPRRLLLTKDVLAIGKGIGEADESLLLSGAEVRLQGAVVLVATKHAPCLTLWLDSASEAEKWAAQMQDASQMADRVHMRSLAQVGQVQRAHQEKVAMLEARVSATLKAAVERTQRINELENLVADGKKRDFRIKELELVVEEKSFEASKQGQRVKELEAALTKKGVNPNGVSSYGALEDAMRFASQMLGNGQETLMDGGTAARLKEAVEQVQRAKPAVDAPVVELVQRLVSALRWPLALRTKLATAEQTIIEQKEIQERTYKELKVLENKSQIEGMEKKQSQAEAQSLKQKLVQAETIADAAKRQVEELTKKYQEALSDLDTGGKGDELSMLREQRDVEAAKRQEAEAQSQELRANLVEAERLAQEAEERMTTLSLTENSRDVEIERLRTQQALTEAQKQQAEVNARLIREKLATSQQALAEAVSKQKLFADAHEEEMKGLRERVEAAEVCRTNAEEDSTILSGRLAAATAQVSKGTAQAQAVQHLQEEQTKQEARRREAENHAKELKELLAAAEKANTESLERQRNQLKEAHSHELRGVYDEHAKAVKEKDAAGVKASELRTQLAAAEKAAEQAANDQKQLMDAKHQEELNAMRDMHSETEKSKANAEAALEELKDKVQAAEEAAKEAVQKRQETLQGEHAKEMAKLRERNAAAEQRREQAEARVRLAENSASATASEVQDRLSAAHKEEVERIRLEQAVEEQSKNQLATELGKKRDEAEQQIRDSEEMAAKQTVEMSRRLATAEKAAMEASAQHQQILDDQSGRDAELQKLRDRTADAETKKREMEKQVSDLKKRLGRMETEDVGATTQGSGLPKYMPNYMEAEMALSGNKVHGASTPGYSTGAAEFRQRLSAATRAADAMAHNSARVEERGALRENMRIGKKPDEPVLTSPDRTKLGGTKPGDGMKPVDGADVSRQATLAHWLAAADQAAEKLKDAQKGPVDNDVGEHAPAPLHKVKETKLELEGRLLAAEKAVGRLRAVDEAPSEAATGASTPAPSLSASIKSVSKSTRTSSSNNLDVGGSLTLPPGGPQAPHTARAYSAAAPFTPNSVGRIIQRAAPHASHVRPPPAFVTTSSGRPATVSGTQPQLQAVRR